jgi:uroporphyrin-III C-methyltransferase/precorrin-2 dehydrogenase/sirohydrochlorin ferrochelatase
VLDRNPVLIAVGTGGASAGLAKQVRLRLEAILPPTLGTLADALYRARDALRTRWPDPTERRRAIDGALTTAGPLDPLRRDSAARLDAWLEGEPLQANDDEVLAIVLTSDDPDDLTLRQTRWLGEADTVLHDAGVPAAILDRARADAVRGSSDGNPVGRTVVIRSRD